MTPPKTARTAASMPKTAFLASPPLLVTADGALDVELEPAEPDAALLLPAAALDEVVLTSAEVDDSAEEVDAAVLDATTAELLEDGSADAEVDAGAELEAAEVDAGAAVAAQAQTAAALD